MKFKKLSSPHLNNDYAGFHPSSSSYSLERIDAGSISPKEFYARFVKTRTPCILVSQHPSSSSSFSNEFSRIFKWKDVKSYLCEKAGGAIVQVERKSEETGAFGSANRRATMTLSNYIDKLYQGDQNLYLTTQYAENNKKNNSGENEEEDALLLDHETAASVREYVQSPCR